MSPKAAPDPFEQRKWNEVGLPGELRSAAFRFVETLDNTSIVIGAVSLQTEKSNSEIARSPAELLLYTFDVKSGEFSKIESGPDVWEFGSTVLRSACVTSGSIYIASTTGKDGSTVEAVEVYDGQKWSKFADVPANDGLGFAVHCGPESVTIATTIDNESTLFTRRIKSGFAEKVNELGSRFQMQINHIDSAVVGGEMYLLVEDTSADEVRISNSDGTVLEVREPIERTKIDVNQKAIGNRQLIVDGRRLLLIDPDGQVALVHQ